MRTTVALSCFLCVFLLAVTGSEASAVKDVRAVLAKIQKAAADEDPAALESAVGAAVLRSVPKDRLQETLAELRAVFQIARVGKVQVVQEKAVAELAWTGRSKGKSQLILVEDGGKWRLASPYVYTVEGATLAARQGKKPARVSLELRTKNEAYGSSAYSFRYATGDAQASKNRMDIWVCHNEDIHARRDGRIVDLGKTKLSKVKSIPVGVAWDRKALIVAGHVYVVHCADKRDRDFYVKLRVKSFDRSVVTLEWTLLSGGFGAPASIHQPEVAPGNVGADGHDGLCGRSAR